MTQTRKQRLRTHFPVLSLFLFSKIKNKNLALQLNRYVPLRVDGQAHLADVLGHSSIETTRIYLMSTGKEYLRQLDKLGLVQ